MYLKILAYMFTLSIPIYDFYIIRGGISLSVVIGSIFLMSVIILRFKMFNNIKYILYRNKFFVYFMICALISSIINMNTATNKTFNHILFYSISFIIYTLCTYLVIEVIGIKKFASLLTFMCVIISLIGFIEMSIYYIQGFDAYASFLNHGHNVGIFMGMPRLRSTFNEPSHYGLFMICILPVVLTYGTKIQKVIVIISIIFTFSSSLFIGVILAILIWIFTDIFKMKYIFKKTYKISQILVVIIIILVGIVFMILSMDIIRTLLDKVINISSMDKVRFNGYILAIHEILKKPFIGYGLANYYRIAPTGIFSWYLQIIYETGVIGFTPIAIFLLGKIKYIRRIEFKGALICYIAFLGQMISMNHYYIPGFWILIGVVDYLYNNKNNLSLYEQMN